jgi:hypothetical protein
VYIPVSPKKEKRIQLDRLVRNTKSNIVDSHAEVQIEYYGAVPSPMNFENIQLGRDSQAKSTASTPRHMNKLSSYKETPTTIGKDSDEEKSSDYKYNVMPE